MRKFLIVLLPLCSDPMQAPQQSEPEPQKKPKLFLKKFKFLKIKKVMEYGADYRLRMLKTHKN